jgi:hypothetical protein
MEENLIGYLMQSLDCDEEQEVESYLRTNPDAAERLELLRQALVPLEADREELEPPPDLLVRTLARVAEYRTRELLSYKVPAPPPADVSPRSWWRRADVLIAASILFLASSLALPGLYAIKRQHDIVACQNNLRGFYGALMAYSDHHQDAFPKIDENPPHNYAGIIVPALRQGGYLTDAVSVNCPASGYAQPTFTSIEALDEERLRDPARYERDIAGLGGCYAYPLGYRENNHYFGPHRVQGYDLLPIMSDKPPFTAQSGDVVWAGNSPNHGGSGQNVLFLGGNVRFAKTRNVGMEGNDIYLNRQGLPQAGLGLTDSVLGPSNFHPTYPED